MGWLKHLPGIKWPTRFKVPLNKIYLLTWYHLKILSLTSKKLNLLLIVFELICILILGGEFLWLEFWFWISWFGKIFFFSYVKWLSSCLKDSFHYFSIHAKIDKWVQPIFAISVVWKVIMGEWFSHVLTQPIIIMALQQWYIFVMISGDREKWIPAFPRGIKVKLFATSSAQNNYYSTFYPETLKLLKIKDNENWHYF